MSMNRTSSRLTPGKVIAGRNLTTISGEPVPIPDGEHLIHLHFRRFAG